MRRRRGFVLLIVVFFAALLMAGIATFLRRSTIDATIVRNRDQAARAEALARGGVRLGTMLLLQDLLEEQQFGIQLETPQDVWALASDVAFEAEDGGRLHLRIEDAGARVNLNALLDGEGAAVSGAEAFLEDFLDADEVSPRGELEDDWYQQQAPPYRAANRPLLSLEELSLVRGFDRALVDALRPYVTVYPFVGGGGPNVNTAPPWVLASLHIGPETDRRLPSVDDVRRLLREREAAPLCPDSIDFEGCADLTTVFPESTFLELGHRSDVFLIEATARVGSVERTLEAVVDRSVIDPPRLLAWRVR